MRFISTHLNRGWPRWTFWAAIPVVISVGFVTGMGLATYLPQEPPPLAGTSPASPAQATNPPLAALPLTGSPSQSDPHWQIATPPGGAQPPPPEGLARPSFSPGNTNPEGLGYETETGIHVNVPNPQTLVESRSFLQLRYGRYPNGFAVDYQVMRHAGTGSSLTGLISVADYQVWAQEADRHPERLQQWLNDAVQTIRVTAQRERFHVAWAVVEVVTRRPAGFADFEVTALDNGSFLVVRPLASTADHSRSHVVLRDTPSLREAAGGRPVVGAPVWSVYGPVLRFNETDIYRPAGLNGAKPLR